MSRLENKSRYLEKRSEINVMNVNDLTRLVPSNEEVHKDIKQERR